MNLDTLNQNFLKNRCFAVLQENSKDKNVNCQLIIDGDPSVFNSLIFLGCNIYVSINTIRVKIKPAHHVHKYKAF